MTAPMAAPRAMETTIKALPTSRTWPLRPAPISIPTMMAEVAPTAMTATVQNRSILPATA